MKIIDGQGAVLGRLAVHAAKLALKGEEVRILNCDKVIITGNRKSNIEKYAERRRRVGSTQRGPKHSRDLDRVVKRTIRGMLPDHRQGRGKEAYARIKCYVGTPKELESEADKAEKFKTGEKVKFSKLKEVIKV